MKHVIFHVAAIKILAYFGGINLVVSGFFPSSYATLLPHHKNLTD